MKSKRINYATKYRSRKKKSSNKIKYLGGTVAPTNPEVAAPTPDNSSPALATPTTESVAPTLDNSTPAVPTSTTEAAAPSLDNSTPAVATSEAAAPTPELAAPTLDNSSPAVTQLVDPEEVSKKIELINANIDKLNKLNTIFIKLKPDTSALQNNIMTIGQSILPGILNVFTNSNKDIIILLAETLKVFYAKIDIFFNMFKSLTHDELYELFCSPFFILKEICNIDKDIFIKIDKDKLLLAINQIKDKLSEIKNQIGNFTNNYSAMITALSFRYNGLTKTITEVKNLLDKIVTPITNFSIGLNSDPGRHLSELYDTLTKFKNALGDDFFKSLENKKDAPLSSVTNSKGSNPLGMLGNPAFSSGLLKSGLSAAAEKLAGMTNSLGAPGVVAPSVVAPSVVAPSVAPVVPTSHLAVTENPSVTAPLSTSHVLPGPVTITINNSNAPAVAPQVAPPAPVAPPVTVAAPVALAEPVSASSPAEVAAPVAEATVPPTPIAEPIKEDVTVNAIDKETPPIPVPTNLNDTTETGNKILVALDEALTPEAAAAAEQPTSVEQPAVASAEQPAVASAEQPAAEQPTPVEQPAVASAEQPNPATTSTGGNRKRSTKRNKNKKPKRKTHKRRTKRRS